ncbi:MAG: T9SS type A sorting domain-containing protein [Candidatus Cloacimonetes bacterium]|nr:T9SS type A sorting domain-containing protein [Candidatus Cloacimonadota bacterium]
MKYRLLLLSLILSLSCCLLAQNWYLDDGTIDLNGIPVKLEPSVTLRGEGNHQYDLNFSFSSQSYADSLILAYSHPDMDIRLKVSEYGGFHAAAKRIEVFADFHTRLRVVDFSIIPVFNSQSPSSSLRGPKAIFSRNPQDNIKLYPYTDRVLEYLFGDRSLFIAAANYSACANIDWLSEDAIHLYDHALHFARLYDVEESGFFQRIDTLLRQAGDSNYYSFLIFEEQPPLLNISRWPYGKDAALVIVNDADGEHFKRLPAVYWGSSNPQSPAYLSKGIIANNIKMTNTVYAYSKPVLEPFWRELMNNGISIGLHTCSALADLSEDTYQGLIYDLADFGVRTWSDNSWSSNPDCICVSGWDPSSPYYVFNAINDSQIDYIWLGDWNNTNPFNSFTEPWRLPHKLYEFEHLTRPVWFFGRTNMSCWEALNHNYLTDFKHNITAENLDQLLKENGLCVVYTHFFYIKSMGMEPFFDTLPNGDLELKDEANASFALLDYYQKYRRLWVDTLEEVFDRMIAIEDLRITGSRLDSASGEIRLQLSNGSDYPLKDLALSNPENPNLRLSLMPGESQSILVLDTTPYIPNPADYLRFGTRYQDGRIYFLHKSSESLPALKIELFNLRGQKLSSHSFESGIDTPVIPLPNAAPGLYLAKVSTSWGLNRYLKVVLLK